MKNNFTLLLSILMMTSCMQDGMFEDVRVKVDTSLPIGSLNFTDQTLFALSNLDDVLTVGKDGVLEIDFSDNLALIGKDKLSSLFTFPAQNQGYNIDTHISIPPVIANGSTITIPSNAPISDKVTLNMPSGDIIKSIIFADGSVSVNFSGSENLSRAYWRIPELKQANGNMATGIFGQSVSLAGYELTPIITGQDNQLTLEIYGEIPFISQIGGRLLVNSSKFTSVSGFLARKSIAIDPISVNLGKGFEDFTKYVDQAYFANPQITLDVTSDFDVPLLMTIESIKIDGKSMALSNETGKTNFIVKKGKTTITLNNSTSATPRGLSDLIGVSSKKIEIKINSVMNPSTSDGDPIDVTKEINIIKASDVANAKYTASVPLDGYLKNIKFEEKIGEFDISSESLDLQSMVMAFTGENKMPIDISVMAYADKIASGNELFDKPIVIPASKSQTQSSVLGKENMQVAKIGQQAVNKLKGKAALVFQFTASTRDVAQKEIVKFYSPTSINLQVMLGAQGEIKPSNAK